MYSAGHGQPVASPNMQADPDMQADRGWEDPNDEMAGDPNDEMGDLCETRFGIVQMKWEKPLGDSCRVHVYGRRVLGRVTSNE